jgi:hypothetical protein
MPSIWANSARFVLGPPEGIRPFAWRAAGRRRAPIGFTTIHGAEMVRGKGTRHTAFRGSRARLDGVEDELSRADDRRVARSRRHAALNGMDSTFISGARKQPVRKTVSS